MLVVKDDYNVTGAYLQTASVGRRAWRGPPSTFTFNTQGGTDIRPAHQRQPARRSRASSGKLGIILDGELYTRPYIKSTISDSGEITGRH